MPNAVEVANLTNLFDPQDVDPRPYIWLKNGQIVEGSIDEGDIGYLTTLVYQIKAQSNCPPIMVRVVEGGYVVESFFATCTAPMIHLNPGESPATNRVFCIIPNGRTNFTFRVIDGGTVWENENPDEYGADIVLTHAPAILDLDAGVPEASEETVGFLLASKHAHADAQRRALSIHGPENTWGYASNIVLTYDTARLRIYDEEDNVLASGTQFYEGDYIPALEVEGLAHSGAMRDAWINIAATGVPVSDRVKTTVLKADIGTVLPLADRTLHPDAARQPLTLKQTLPSDWNGLMTLSWSGAMAYWTPTGGTPIVSGSVFSNALLPQIIYLEGDGCGTNEAVFSVVGLSDCKTNLALSIFGMNATLAGVNEADELAPGGFIADRSVHTNAPRTMLTLEACGPVAATGNVVLTWNSSVVQIYTAAAGGSPLAQFIRPYNGFTATNLYVEGIAPGSNTLAWTYSAQTNCADKIKLTVLRVVTETVATTPSDRTRKTVGVGEEVNLRIMPSGISGTWSTSGGNINPAIGNSTFVEVPHVATSITVTVSCGSGVLCDIPFSVLEPSGYLAPVNTPITGYGTNIAGAGMTINLWLPPTNVSFYRVEIVEVEAISTNATGYFANTNVWPAWKLDHGLCGAGAWVPVGMNNYIGTDTANSGACPPPWTDGHFSWPIPGGWRVIGNTPTNNLPWSDQDFTINSNGTVTLLKFGHGVTRATNDVYTVVY